VIRVLFLFAFPAALSIGLAAEDLTPRVGTVEIYGAHKSSVEKIRAALGVHEGSPLPSSKGNVEDRIDKVPGVIASRLEAACCLDGKTILYVGIEEKDSLHIEYRPEPDGDITLQSELTDNYAAFLDAVNQSIRGGQHDENLSHGYSLMADAAAQERQRAFIPLAAKYLETVHRVIRDSRDSDQRAMAAYIMQYGPRGPHTSQQLVNDLQFALRDVDDTVRANAIRSLTAMYVGAKLHPDQGITVQPTWFVELLNSIVWSDRHNASVALVDMTEDHDRDTLQLIRQRALGSVIEMARWRDLSHALPAFILAGRLAGLDEKAIQAAWVSPGHDEVLKQALKKPKSSV
jgi:hypothetical protein